MFLSVFFDANPETLKYSNRRGVWQLEETEDRRQVKDSYYSPRRRNEVSKIKTWLPYDSAVKLLKKYPQFQGLSFVLTANLGKRGDTVHYLCKLHGEYDTLQEEQWGKGGK